MEVMLMGEGQSWYWVFIFLCLSIVISYILSSFYKRDKALLIMRILDATILSFAVLTCMSFLSFTQDLLEPWLIQGAFFLRYNGILIGILVSCITIKTVLGLSFLISTFNKLEKEEKKDKQLDILTMVIISMAFLFYIIEILLYRFYTLYSSLLVIFIIQIVLLGLSIYLISNTKHQAQLRIHTKNPINYFEKEKKSKEERKESSFSRINKKLEESGTKPRTFWWLGIPLLGIAICCVILIILYPMDLLFFISFPAAGGTIALNIPTIQLFSILLMVLMLFILLPIVIGTRTHHKVEKYFKKRSFSYIGSISFGLLDVLKILGLFIVFSQVLYFYDYPIFFPVVISYYLLFGIVGVIIYFSLGRTKWIKNILFIIAVLLLVYNFYLTYLDGTASAINYSDGSFDIAFPYEYLHSLTNYILVGIPLGIILSDTFLKYIVDHSDGTDSSHRAVFAVFICFIGMMILMVGNWLMNNPGGDIGAVVDASTFYLFCLVFIIILISGLSFHIITEIMLPLGHRLIVKRKWREKRMRAITSISKGDSTINQGTPRKKVIAVSCAALVTLSVLGGLALFYTYQETYKKPILAYSPGNYYIWLLNSSERVAKNTEICLESSPVIDAVELSVAKNEYAAFQLVWRPLRTYIYGMTYDITDFTHQNTPSEIIGSNNFSLRYEEYVIEEEFPDVLIPFSEIDIDKKQNYVFWFSFKVPYDALEGEYHGNLTFNMDGGVSQDIEIHINVWNFTMTNRRHLSTNIGPQTNDPERIENYIYHRMNDYGVPIRKASSNASLQANEIYTCYLNETSGNWTFNWDWWDNLTQYKLDNGMNAFYINGGVGVADGRVPYINNATRMQWMKNYLSDVQRHLETKGWLNYSYYYFIDEFQMFIPEGYTRAEYFAELKILLHEMKDAAPKIKIMTTTPPSAELEDLRDYIDIFCPVSNDRDQVRWDEQLELGKEFWFYACVGPMAPWPNSHLYNRLYECRVLIWQVWQYKLHGFLYWSSSAYYHGKHGMGYNGYGDGWFIYTRDGVLYDTLRWENYLDGQEDYEYIWLLDEYISYLKNNPGIIAEAKLNLWRSELDSIVNSVVGEKWQYCDHPSTIYEGRERIGAILHEIGNTVNMTAIGEAPWAPPYHPGI